MGVPSQRGAERADLLPDAKAGAEAEPDGSHGRWRRSCRTSCSGSERTSGSGIAARPDRRRPSCRARRNGSAISPRLSTQLRNPVNPITERRFADSSGAACVSGNVIRPTCISPVARGLLDSACAAVLHRLRRHAGARRRAIMPVTWRAATTIFSTRNQMNAHVFVRPQRQLVLAGQHELHRAGSVQRREPGRGQRHAHLQSATGHGDDRLVSDLTIGRRRRHADRTARSG